jgi:hypothetical protein
MVAQQREHKQTTNSNNNNNTNDNNSHTSPHGRLNSHAVSHEMPSMWKSSRTKGRALPAAEQVAYRHGRADVRDPSRQRQCFGNYYYFLFLSIIYFIFFLALILILHPWYLIQGPPALVSFGCACWRW